MTTRVAHVSICKQWVLATTVFMSMAIASTGWTRRSSGAKGIKINSPAQVRRVFRPGRWGSRNRANRSDHTPGDFLMSYTNSAKEDKSFDQVMCSRPTPTLPVFYFSTTERKCTKPPCLYPQTMGADGVQQPRNILAMKIPRKKWFRVGEGNQQQNYEVTGIVKDISR